MSSLCRISVISPSSFDSNTLQTAGSQRAAAISPSQGIKSAMWGGVFAVDPGVSTGVHHHGEQETIAYMLEGKCLVRWGDRGEFSAVARQGDFIHVPAWLLHMEVNTSASKIFRWLVVRSTPTPIVVNFPDVMWTD